MTRCWSHAHRKWHETLKAMPVKTHEGSDAMKGKEYCGRLFKIEQHLAELSHEESRNNRQEISKPLIE